MAKNQKIVLPAVKDSAVRLLIAFQMGEKRNMALN